MHHERPLFTVLLPAASGSKQTSRRSAESRTCHTRQRLDGDGAAQRHSQTDRRSWRLGSEQPGPATRAVQNLRISDSLAASVACPPPPIMGNSWRRPRPRPKQQPREPREYLRCARCGPVADAHWASTDGGRWLMTVWGQLRWLNRQTCVHCGTIRSQRCRRCNSCGFDTPLRELRVGDTFQDGRQPRQQDAAASGLATGQQLPQSSQPVPQGETLDDSPLPNCSIRDVVLTDRDKQLLPSSAGHRRWHSRDVWSLDTPRLGQKVSKEP